MTASADAEVEAAQLLVEARALDRIVVAAQRDRPSPDPLDEREQLGAGLLRDDLAEQRAEQPDLDRERVAGAGRPDPERLRGDRRRDARRPAGPVTRGPPHGTVPVLDPPPDRNLPGRNLSLRLYGDGQ